MALPVAFIALLWASVSYIIYVFVASTLRSRRHAARARELKCEEPAVMRNKYPGGIDNIMQALAADKKQLFPLYMIQRTVDAGSITHKYSVLGQTNITTADEKNIQAILATQFADFDLGPVRRGNFFPLLGGGIFTQDGKAWEHSRAMMRPQFARNQVSDLDLEERHLMNLMRSLDTSMQSNNWTGLVDLQVLFFRLTLDSATEFLFGHSVDSQVRLLPGFQASEPHDPADDFATSFDRAQAGLARRARFGNFYWMSSPKEFKDACKGCHKFIDQFVHLAISKDLREKELEKGVAGAQNKYIFLEALAAQTQDPIELRSQLLHILLAGRDTTASLLGWLWFELARDPARYKKLRETVIEDFGTYENPSEITFSKLKSCQYLQNCNNEALRLYPVVPINSRFANKDTTIPRGGGKDGKSPIFVPQGTGVDYPVHVMHRRKDIWGPDADVFRPERFENRKLGWEFLPFNGGPRICIGQQFALTEASYVTVRLLQRFDKIENLETDPIVRHNVTLTNCSGNGVKVRMHAV